MTAVALPYSQRLQLRPRRVTRQTTDEACRVIRRSFESHEIADLRTNYVVRATQDDEDGSIGVSASTLDDLLSSDALTEAVPLNATVELTNLTIAAQNAARTVRIIIAVDGVDIDIASVDQDWVQGRARDFRMVFTPGRRPWPLKASFERRDFITFGIGLDVLGTAVLFAVSPQGLLGSTAGRITLAVLACLVPAACWLAAGRIVRRSRVRIASAEPIGWWRSMDTMTKLTLGLFAAAVLTLALSIAQNGLTGDSHAYFPPTPTAIQEDGKQ
ncbi:hypothetical protein [Streptomyces sp. NPDC021212]|uniref:hypothetical protein n=1 Tax=Streptomyces sp. NPDC021212 TaxID=3365118 RepID=UPI003792756B